MKNIGLETLHSYVASSILKEWNLQQKGQQASTKRLAILMSDSSTQNALTYVKVSFCELPKGASKLRLGQADGGVAFNFRLYLNVPNSTHLKISVLSSKPTDSFIGSRGRYSSCNGQKYKFKGQMSKLNTWQTIISLIHFKPIYLENTLSTARNLANRM